MDRLAFCRGSFSEKKKVRFEHQCADVHNGILARCSLGPGAEQALINYQKTRWAAKLPLWRSGELLTGRGNRLRCLTFKAAECSWLMTPKRN